MPALVVAVGEAGLDFHYEYSPRGVQADVFAAQVALANERGMPLVVHSREAWEETFAVLDAEGVPDRTVFHCFTGGPDVGAACLERGAFLSFSGIVTFKGADDVRAAAAGCPLGRALVETDSPFLAPVPHRGRPNEPANVVHVGAAVAEAMDRSVAEVAAATLSRVAAVLWTSLIEMPRVLPLTATPETATAAVMAPSKKTAARAAAAVVNVLSSILTVPAMALK